MQQLTQGVYAVPGLSIGRVYVLEGKDGLAVIDASLATNTYQKLERQLQQHRYGLGDVKHILITHAHPDHFGGLLALQRATNARTIAHRRDAPVIRGEQPGTRPSPQDLDAITRLMLPLMSGFPMPAPARVDHEVQEGDTLDDVIPGLQVVETPGHSPGHVAYWLPEKRVLFGGDTVLRTPWGGLRPPFALFTTDMAEAKRSIRKIATMDVDILCPGHGAPLVGNAAASLRAFAARLWD